MDARKARCTQSSLKQAFFTTLWLLLLAAPCFAEDMTVWQGQYYTNTTFHQGTYEINFTVYDAMTGGTACYTNSTNLTTGAFGEWRTEQWGINAACNNATKSYWLDISVDGVPQPPRKKIAVGTFVRKDADEEFNNSVTFNDELTATSQNVHNLLVENSLAVISNTNSHFSGTVVANLNNSNEAASTLYVSNNIGMTVTLAIASNGYTPLEANTGALLYGGNESFQFLLRNDSQAWRWRTYYLQAGNVSNGFNEIDLMELTSTGQLHLYRGGLNLHANNLTNVSYINASGDICSGNGNCLNACVVSNMFNQVLNTTSSVGFAAINSTTVLATNSNTINANITNLYVISFNATNTNTTNLQAVNSNITNFQATTSTTTNANITNLRAVSINATNYYADGFQGITDNSSFQVCTAQFLGSCSAWCFLTIRDGLIVGCV